MKTNEVNNSQEVIDSRDVIKRIEELEDLISNNKELPKKKREDLTEEETELELLKDLEDQANTSNWKDGETLIRESYFVEYVEEMLKDRGDLPKDIPWYIVIDWEATAENIKADYITIDFDGVDYLIRG